MVPASNKQWTLKAVVSTTIDVDIVVYQHCAEEWYVKMEVPTHDDKKKLVRTVSGGLSGSAVDGVVVCMQL